MAFTRKRLAGPALGTTADQTAYTVPANTKTRVTQIHFACNGSVGTTSVHGASIGAIASANALVPVTAVIAGGTVADYYGAPTGFILEAGETLHVKADVNVAWAIFGEEITLG